MQEVRDGNIGTSAPSQQKVEDDVVEVLSTPLEVRELHGLSRCMACQEQDRKCYVDQKSPQCFYCRAPDDCMFRRTVERSMNAFNWNEVAGTVAGQKRHLDDGDSNVNRKLRPIEDHRPPSVLPAPDVGVNGRLSHDVSRPWLRDVSNRAPYPVHIPSLNLEPGDTRMVRRIPVPPLPPPPPPPIPQVKRPESQDRNGIPRTDPALYCDQCQVHFSTNSEYSKHMSRHTKRFRCDVAGCKKIDGFATLNDLDRHRKSVHGAYDIEDPVWKCFVEGCKSREKIWPRQDNFKAHLERMHRGVDVEHYVKVSDRWLETEERPARLAAKQARGNAQAQAQGQAQNQTQSQQAQSQPPSQPQTPAANHTNAGIGTAATAAADSRSETRDEKPPVAAPVPVEGERTRRESGRIIKPTAAALAAAAAASS